MVAVRRITLLTNPDVCNLRCPLCFLYQRRATFGEISGITGEMPFDVAKAAIEKYGLTQDENGKRILREVIPSTMGEPLLYSRFEDLLELCGSLGVPMNLTTNGTFPGMWNENANMIRLLQGCSDIKVSSLASECFDGWKRNVERLLKIRQGLPKAASVSIQVTLHRKNLMMIPELIAWATVIGVERIKWNMVVFLSEADVLLRREFELDRSVGELREYILNCCRMCGSSLRNEGSVFALTSGENARGYSLEAGTCPFAEELWILPDGSEQHCPNPERRFGNKEAPEARCCFIR